MATNLPVHDVAAWCCSSRLHQCLDLLLDTLWPDLAIVQKETDAAFLDELLGDLDILYLLEDGHQLGLVRIPDPLLDRPLP